MSWLPGDFVHPVRVPVPGTALHLRPIREADAAIDYPAVMGSRARLWEIFGPAWAWPRETMTLDEDRHDLLRHEEEIAAHQSFNYALLDEQETAVLGCVYIDPPERAGSDGEISWWVVDDLVGGEAERALDLLLPQWIAAQWPFLRPRYLGRDISWPDWLALPPASFAPDSLTVTEADVALSDGRTLHCYDTHAGQSDTRVAVFWHHGTPNVGAPPEPLFPAAAAQGLRWVSYDRPGYGGSSPNPGRDIASAAADVAAIADALGLGRFAVVGHSGGGPHALACGALLPERVVAVVSLSAPAPFDAAGLDWFAGWSGSGVAEQRAALAGRAALEAYLPTAEFDPETFTPADESALEGPWSWLAGVAGQAMEEGDEGMVEDLLAGARPWGFAPADITVPVLILHGDKDRMVPSAHGEWLAAHCPTAELRLAPGAGHITVLDSAPAALEWLRDQVGR